MRESGDEKSTLRQIEKIKALSEDMLEYQAIDVHKAWQSMERRAKRKASMRMFSLFYTRAAAILVVPLLIYSLFFSFLLYFLGENVMRILFASSIGVSEWNFSQSYTEMASKQFKKFVALSCREITGANVLSQKFKLNVKQVLDPTLLHQDYKEITGFIQETKNLVFYPLSVGDTSAVSFCKELATKLNLKYVNANPYTFIPFLPIIWKRNSIAQWMSAIGGASLVVTGSFHGLAFSLIYHRQFILINDNKQGRNSRMMDLLNYLGLEHRLFRTTEEAMASRVWEDTIDYQLIDEKLNQARNESWNYLKQSLS